MKQSQTVTIVLPSDPPIKPVMRVMRFDIPLEKLLKTKKLGGIIGSRTGVKSCDIDVLIPEDKLDIALLSIGKKLRKLDCPDGTRIIVGTQTKKVK